LYLVSSFFFFSRSVKTKALVAPEFCSRIFYHLKARPDIPAPNERMYLCLGVIFLEPSLECAMLVYSSRRIAVSFPIMESLLLA